MATSRRPSYLKRQKEQARLARANQKRQERLERKRSGGGGAPIGSLEDLIGAGDDESTVPADADDGDDEA